MEALTGAQEYYGQKEAIESAFLAIGYQCEIVSKEILEKNVSLYKQKIIQSIDKGLPVFTYGIVGPPCCSLINFIEILHASSHRTTELQVFLYIWVLR